MTSAHPCVVVVGSVNVDLTTRVDRHPTPGETVLGSGSMLTAGGKGANQAVAAALLGAPTAMVGAVGDDANAEIATAQLKAAGVDLRAVEAVPGPTGLAVVTVAGSGENTIVVVAGANASVTPRQVDRRADLISGAGVCVLQGELPTDTTERAVRIAASADVRVLLNLAPVIRLPAEVVAMADPLVVNEHEARLTLAELGVEPPPMLPSDPVAAASTWASILLEMGPRSVVVTSGAAGAVVAETGAGATHLQAPQVQVRDTTGAGDAFVGALAACLVKGESLESAAGTAVRAGAYSVRGAGAQQSFPSREDRLP